MKDYITNSFALSTQATYASGVSTYRKFLQYIDRDTLFFQAPTYKVVMLFITFLAHVLQFSFSGVKTYIQALRSWSICNDLGDPLGFSTTQEYKYKRLLTGIKRTTASTKRIRKALTYGKMKRLFAAAKKLHTSTFEIETFRCALLVGFHGFLRAAEYLSTQYNMSSRLRRKDIRLGVDQSGREYIRLRLRSSKTSQFDSTKVYISETHKPTCPVAALREYLRSNSGSRGRPLFNCAGVSLTSSRFNRLFKEAALLAGFNPHHYASHSLRSGAATSTASAGVPYHLVKDLGRWKSSCFLRYLVTNKASLLRAQAKTFV